MTHNPYLNLCTCISSPFSKFRPYGATGRFRPRASSVASSSCLPIVSVSNILCLVSTWNSVLLFHCIFLHVFIQLLCHRLYFIINFSKYLYFSVHITERNSSLFIHVITAKHTVQKSAKNNY